MTHATEKAPLAQSETLDNTDELLSVLTDAELFGLVDVDRAKALRCSFAVGLIEPSDLGKHVIAMLADGPAAKLALNELSDLFGSDATIEIVAIIPDGSRVSYCGRLGVPEERAAIEALIRKSLGRANLYVGVNLRHKKLAGKSVTGRAEDIVAREYFVFDFDYKDAPPHDPRYEEKLALLKRGEITECPILIVNTGNGAQVWMQICDADTPKRAANVTPIIKNAMRLMGSDDMSDLARIVRLPWTINLPNKAKRARGNSLCWAVPADAEAEEKQ